MDVEDLEEVEEATEQPPYPVDPANIVLQQADLVRRVMSQITEMHLAIALRDAAIAQLRERLTELEAVQLVGTNGHLEGVAITEVD
jgi:hypothetical protein